MKMFGKETKTLRKNIMRYTTVLKKEIAKGKREGRKMGVLLRKESTLIRKKALKAKKACAPVIRKESTKIRGLMHAKKRPGKSRSSKRGGK